MPVPSLGRQVIHWMYANLLAPDSADPTPFTPTREQRDFLRDYYAVEPITGRRLIRRGVISRPKGWGKSPILAAVAAVEGLGPVVFGRWAEGGETVRWGAYEYTYEPGEPIGKPWREIRTPLVHISAVSEDQTRNAWDPLLEMLGTDAPVRENYPGLEPLQTFVSLPQGGRIEFVTASAKSREGNKPIFCVLDQTETWTVSNGGVRLAATMRRNLAKTGGSSIESPNAYLPGEESVAEQSAAYWETIKQGKARDEGLLYDHREAPADTNLTDRDSLIAGLRLAYGCSAAMPCVLPGHDHAPGWVDLDRIVAEVWDPNTDPQDSARFYLNQITHASDSLVSQPEWGACLEAKALVPGDTITLGFDGSRGRAKGKPDATALVGCRVSDGHLVEFGVWEADNGPGMETWEPPLVEIDALLDDVMKRYDVAAFYADPAKDWRSKVNEWEQKYAQPRPAQRHKGARVKMSRDHPFEWWFQGRSVFIERAVLSFAAAVRNGESTHDGAAALTRHVLNTRRRIRSQKLTVGKKHDHSPDKIDACVAAILAWQARLDCVAAGVGTKKTGRIIRVR